MQDLDSLYETRIDKVPRRVGETTNIELIGNRDTIDDNRDAIAADTANIQAFGSESGARAFVIDARDISKYVADRGRYLVVYVGSRQRGDMRRNITNRAFVLVRDDNDLIDDG